MKKKVEVATDYLNVVYRDPTKYKASIKMAAKFIRKFKKLHKFNSIAFTGTSGASFAYPLSLELGVHLTCIRKRKEKSHANELVEGAFDPGPFIIVDDFIETGDTIDRILNEMKKFSPKSKCVGIYLFNDARTGFFFPAKTSIPKIPFIKKR